MSADKKVIILDEEEVNKKTDGLEYMLGEADEKIKEIKETIQESNKKKNIFSHEEKVMIVQEIYEYFKKHLKENQVDQEKFLATTANTMTNAIIVKSTPLMKVAINEALKDYKEEDLETAKKLDTFSGNFNKLIDAIESMDKLAPAPADNEELFKKMDERFKKLESQIESTKIDKKDLDKLIDVSTTFKQAGNDIVDRATNKMRSFGYMTLGMGICAVFVMYLDASGVLSISLGG